ncbi:AraC family transcriptional regulator [Sphingomonas bacterium]|uniref:AraC family transcriptional regulator n=1 Tax=Sphingomonas bacterium TaxID=1895847 RepID=UPI001C2DDA4D|nr:AraC family transcriptional regulator [Sphingomonas bacterium]
MIEHVDGYVGNNPHTHDEGGAAVVRIDALRSFNEVVTSLGGDPAAILARAQIDPALLDNRNAVISYRLMVHLLERCASELGCPDFGLRLGAAQGGAKVLGPLEIVMRNSSTLGDAFRYCAEHIQAYSPSARICLEPEWGAGRTFLRFEILLAHLPYQRQTVEQALLLTQHAAISISGAQARACEIWFSHEPLAPIAVYRAHFNGVVRFGQSSSGLFFYDHDLARSISDPDPQLYELATTFIDTRFPSAATTMTTRVRSIVAKLLVAGQCTNSRVASTLGLHPRTLQRRLREEGECFEMIKDSVRRDVALRYLRQPEVPLIRVAEMLGYSEASVLSRSCYRWFAESPRQLRNKLTQAA